MYGVLFVINIPTDREEKRLREQLKKNPPSPNATEKSSFIQYGTFYHQDKSSPSPGKHKEAESEKSLSFEEHHTFNIADSTMEIILRDILKKFKIENAAWTKSTNEKFYQVMFSIQFDEAYEALVKEFNEWGVGDREGSTISILHCATFNTFVNNDNNDVDRKERHSQKQTAWHRFMNSFQARLNVAQIVRDIKQDATITFDFIVLLISAAILASFGLVGDSTIFLASSMLVSPLMGPIIATIFGTAIKDRSLLSLGIINELLGIVLATLVGYIFGIIMCVIDEKYETEDGFTAEILSRCELNSLLIGFLAAVPSGAAAAIAVLGGKIGSLVGVAISASILPSAVNSGIVWSFASVCLVYQSDRNRFNFAVKEQLYSDNQAFELLIRGAISMCITLSNVICIYVMGIIVLKIKEIAPTISRSNHQFWKHDIKIARDLNRNCNDGDNLTHVTNTDDAIVYGPKFINIGNAFYQNTWSPMGNQYNLDFFENRSNLKQLEKLYMTVKRPNYDPLKYLGARTNIPISDTPNRTTLTKQFRVRTGSNLKWQQPLEEAYEGSSTLDNKKKSTRFIITPALDSQLPSV